MCTKYQISGGGSMQKVGGLKYSAPNINVYVLMIFTAFSLKSGGGACPACPPYSASYADCRVGKKQLTN